jgi:hypothetical protein
MGMSLPVVDRWAATRRPRTEVTSDRQLSVPNSARGSGSRSSNCRASSFPQASASRRPDRPHDDSGRLSTKGSFTICCGGSQKICGAAPFWTLSFDEKAGLVWAWPMPKGTANGQPRSALARSMPLLPRPTTAQSFQTMIRISPTSTS